MSCGLNYSRWDSVSASSDGSDDEASLSPSSDSSALAGRLRESRMYDDMPAFVKLDPKDDGTGLLDAFYEHPDKFRKHVSPRGVIESWGLYPYIPSGQEGAGSQDFGSMEMMMRKMSTQMIYRGGEHRRPEDQFVDRLIEKKISELKAVDLGDLVKSDYVLRIHMNDIPNATGEDRIWRTFRVSGGLKLGVFADKVLRPLMGWTRNLHAHVFTDYRDGALFGPKNAGSVDVVHMDMLGYGYVPEENWRIAHVLRVVGDKMGWLYDFGDRWYHEIKLEAKCSPETSTGAVTVLQGSGACPPENGRGNYTWVNNIKTLENGKKGERKELLDEICDSVNYKERKWTSRKTFDADKFGVVETQEAVRQAMDSKGSLAHGAKSFIMPVAPNAGSFARLQLRKDEKLQQTFDPDEPYGYFQEVLSDKRDRSKKTACSNCGSPHELRLCNGCKQRYYCSVQCQRTHWRAKHKSECKNLK